MSSWQSLLTKLVKHAPVEPVFFCVREPSGKPWPKTLPSSSSLIEFYSLCDGGDFSALQILPVQTIRAQLPTLLRSIDLAAIAAQPEHIIVFGFNSYNFLHFVDIENDLVSAYNPSGMDWEHYNQSFDAFMQDLFTPGSRYRDEATDDWTEVLEQLERLP